MKVKKNHANLNSHMEITFLGHASFKIKGKDITLITDPYDSDMVAMKFPKQDADIVTISHHHADHDKIDNITNVKKVIDGPGEYEVRGVSIIGISSFHDASKGAERGKNTIYVIEMEGMRLVHLGDLGHVLTESQIKEIGVVDIMMIPVGGTYTIDAKTAVEVFKQLGASIVLPMHYGGSLAPVEDFIAESSLRVEKLPKLAVKKDAINNEESYAVILEKK